ncbi:MAG TPA: magnesium transporter CorA family protein [Spirochaetia bacterium]|nr:magnesium transporter CorA family protein [Spirochaetales bacterium]HRS65398.1 magnesium transporter CorA family protein [Spirochaetia bacterium]HOT58116.1 magnesium transporter CorA family protein [Spirochaetales bacterium]HPD80401.1 magnesium transporter CorA family protein [Spirochaetales bacterium]HQG39524.1 magnesium transporter CorA family protein [Spirochaetales bacterium]
MKKQYQANVHTITPSQKGKIFHYYAMSQEEMDELITLYKLDPHTIASALDPDEVPRMEYEDGILSIIWKLPTNFNLKEIKSFNVSTMGIFVVKKHVILITSEDKEFFTGSLNLSIDDPYDVVMVVIERTIKHFVEHLRVIKMLSKEIQEKINTSMGNEYLLQMFNLSEILIYYLDAINSNKSVLVKLNGWMEKQNVGDIDYMEDILIEVDQAARQTEIYSQVFTGLMDARGSIVNNNMNNLIKRLTIINIIFLPLNLIAGIGGMSEYSMMTEQWGWPIAYGLFSIAMVIIGFITYRVLNRLEGSSINKQRKL